MTKSAFTIRRARREDIEAAGRLGALLLRAHHSLDGQRFMAPRQDSEQGYAWFLGTQLDRDDALVLVAERDGAIAGYAWATIEPLNWKELREEAGFIQDVCVDGAARRGGLASALVEEAARWLAGRGVPRVMLWTAARNDAARTLFARLGFRETMIEMTREAPAGAARDPDDAPDADAGPGPDGGPGADGTPNSV